MKMPSIVLLLVVGFLSVYKTAYSLTEDTDKSILEKALLDQWERFSEEKWKRGELIKPLVELKSQAAIPFLIEIASDSDFRWFRRQAMEALIVLKTDRLDEFLLEIYPIIPDAWNLSWSALNNSESVSGKNLGDYLVQAMSDERIKDNPRVRAEFLLWLVDMRHPSAYDMALESLASKYMWEKHAAYTAFHRLRDKRAYSVLVREFDSESTSKPDLMAAMIASDDESASRFLISRLDNTALSDAKSTLDIVVALGNSRSPFSFEKLSRRLATEIDSGKPFTYNSSTPAPTISLIGALINSLIRIDPVNAKEVVLPLTKNPDIMIRRTTISALGDRRGVRWAIEALREMLPDNSVAHEAADALLKIDYRSAAPVILQRLENRRLLLTPQLKESFLKYSDIYGDEEARRRLTILERELRGEKVDPSKKHVLEIDLRLNPQSRFLMTR